MAASSNEAELVVSHDTHGQGQAATLGEEATATCHEQEALTALLPEATAQATGSSRPLSQEFPFRSVSGAAELRNQAQIAAPAQTAVMRAPDTGSSPEAAPPQHHTENLTGFSPRTQPFQIVSDSDEHMTWQPTAAAAAAAAAMIRHDSAETPLIAKQGR